MNSKFEKVLTEYSKAHSITNKRELIKAVEEIIDSEVAKAEDEMDTEIIDEGVDFLLTLEGVDGDELERNIKEVTENIIAQYSEDSNSDGKVIGEKTATSHFNRKKLCTALIAAALVVVLMSTAVVAIAYDDIRASIEMLFKDKKDFTDDDGDDYIYVGSDTKRYSSVQKLAEIENITFLYPSVLPKGLEITAWDSFIHDNVHKVTALFSDPYAGYAFSVVDQVENIDDFKRNGEEIIINDLTVYAAFDQHGCYVRWIYKNKTYRLDVAGRDGLMMIVENLKEVTYD